MSKSTGEKDFKKNWKASIPDSAGNFFFQTEAFNFFESHLYSQEKLKHKDVFKAYLPHHEAKSAWFSSCANFTLMELDWFQ